ncbi:MAG: hypothetical protein ACLUW6_08145, partial [Coriobacteriaceae bacterium]
IMEDMKVSGLKQRRLHEMLKFFYRNWTELAGGAEDDDGWLIPGEEADVHALLKDVLHFTGGILEPEASAMAVRFLLARPDALADVQRSYVLVDDYQMHSRASQHLANLLARDSVTVAADPTGRDRSLRQLPLRRGHRRIHPGQRGLRTRRAEREPRMRGGRVGREPPVHIAGCGRGAQ